jgi:recombination protein RecA
MTTENDNETIEVVDPMPGEKVPKLKMKAKKDTLSRIIGKINKCKPRNDKEGTIEVSRSNQNILSSAKFFIRTGIRSFDDMTTGGIPGGRITEIYGPEGCGKTALSIRACVKGQTGEIYERLPDKTFVKYDKPYEVSVVYVDNEQSLDEGDRMVVDGIKADFAVVRCDTVAQLFKTIDLVLTEVMAIEAETKIKQFVIVVVDTIASTSSTEEMTSEWGKQDYSRQPKQLREGFRIMMRDINRAQMFFIGINQVSDNFNSTVKKSPYASQVPQEEEFSSFGGKALKFYSSLRVFMALAGPYKTSKKQTNPAGLQFEFFVKKNRQGVPLRKGRVVLLFSGGFSDTYSTLEHLMRQKLITMGSGGDYVFKLSSVGLTGGNTSLDDMEDGKGDELVCPSKDEWPAFLEKHRAVLDKFWAATVIKTLESDVPMDAVPDDEDDILEDEEL